MHREVIDNKLHKSLNTAMIYLNLDYEDGRTKFCSFLKKTSELEK